VIFSPPAPPQSRGTNTADGQQRHQPLAIASLRDHAVANVALGHQTHFIGHPFRHKSRHVRFKRGRIVAAVVNRSPERLSPYRSGLRSGKGIGSDNIDGFDRQFAGSPVASYQFDSGHLGNIAHIDHRQPDVSDRHRINAVVEDDLFNHRVVIDVIGRPQDGGAKIHRREHLLRAVLNGKVGNVHRFIRLEHRKIDDPFNAAFAGDVQGNDGLRKLIGRDGVQQEKRANAREGGAQGVEIEQLAFNRLDAWPKAGSVRVTRQYANSSAAADKLGDDMAADTAGGAGNKNSHDVYSVMSGGCKQRLGCFV